MTEGSGPSASAGRPRSPDVALAFGVRGDDRKGCGFLGCAIRSEPGGEEGVMARSSRRHPRSTTHSLVLVGTLTAAALPGCTSGDREQTAQTDPGQEALKAIP